MEYGFGLDNE
jgi:hypothetical protein